MSWRKELTWKVDPEKGCWNCTSHKPDAHGYPQFMRDGKNMKAHRYIWQQTHGPIPPGMFICHHCDNTMCIRPSHLFLGTAADNNRDMAEKGRASRATKAEGEANGNSKLTEADVRYIREHTEIGAVEMARLTKVSRQVVRRIRLGEMWKHL